MPSKRPAASSSPGSPRGGARGELPSPAEISNRMVWQGESGRYEVWFFTLFHAASGVSGSWTALGATSSSGAGGVRWLRTSAVQVTAVATTATTPTVGVPSRDKNPAVFAVAS